MFQEHAITRLAFERDTEPYAKQRDSNISQMAQNSNVEVMTRTGHTLCEPEDILACSNGKPSTSYEKFRQHFSSVTKQKPIVVVGDAPTALPPAEGVDPEAHRVPTLEEIGYETPNKKSPFPGGETEGLIRLRRFIGRTNWVANFEKPKTSPAAFEPASTTVLSPYLKFGCVSPRHFYLELQEVYRTVAKHSQPPVSLEGQLLWREFYYVISVATPNYDRMQANPICRQVPWVDDAAKLEAWEMSQTGYPWIDAIMAQLREEGWIHHLARHAVACFLTRGDLWCSWERGAAVFDKYLLDADWALNNGNWMWLSCSCFFYQYFRCYSPVAFPKKYDKEGAYVKRWLPQLKHFPAKHIYEPWKASLAEQEKAGCVIGVDYPHRIVVHELESKALMTKMAAAYAEHKKIEEEEKSQKKKAPSESQIPSRKKPRIK